MHSENVRTRSTPGRIKLPSKVLPCTVCSKELPPNAVPTIKVEHVLTAPDEEGAVVDVSELSVRQRRIGFGKVTALSTDS